MNLRNLALGLAAFVALGASEAAAASKVYFRNRTPFRVWAALYNPALQPVGRVEYIDSGDRLRLGNGRGDFFISVNGNPAMRVDMIGRYGRGRWDIEIGNGGRWVYGPSVAPLVVVGPPPPPVIGFRPIIAPGINIAVGPGGGVGVGIGGVGIGGPLIGGAVIGGPAVIGRPGRGGAIGVPGRNGGGLAPAGRGGIPAPGGGAAAPGARGARPGGAIAPGGGGGLPPPPGRP